VNAVILAAGRGTRMGALTTQTPKPLLPLCGKPIIEHILLGLRGAGVRDAIVVTGYRGEQIETALGDGGRLGMRLRFRRQERPEGTARALLLTRSSLGDEPFVLSWGDVVVSPGEYEGVLEDFQRRPCAALLTVNRTEDPWRGAAVYLDQDRQVTALIEKPPRGTSKTPWNNDGVFVFTPSIFDFAEGLQASARGEYELTQAVAAMIADGLSVRAHPLRGFWSALGTPEDLAAAEAALRATKAGT
jgi:dTDP-glucose pyrophosphorylase